MTTKRVNNHSDFPKYMEIEHGGYKLSLKYIERNEFHDDGYELMASPVLTDHNRKVYGVNEYSMRGSFSIYSLPISDVFLLDTNTHCIRCKIDIPGVGFSNIEIHKLRVKYERLVDSHGTRH